MTLSRQLVLLLLALVTLLYIGTFSISVYHTRAYLEDQLSSHAQDAATSLGLSATTHFASEDRAMVTAMVNAMFHRGDYQMIRLEDLSGEPWVERRTERLTDRVPDWFVEAVTLHPPERTATMMSGWRQVGRVRVISHPGLAYEKLWQTMRQTLTLFLLVVLTALLLALFGLRLVLRPLRDVEAQAEAICNREFAVSERRPFTLELRRVVEAMDRLSAKVSRMLSESEAVATQLRRQAYQDPVTGLANRRQLMDVLESRVADPDLVGGGGLILIQLRDFKAFNLEHGYPAGDRLLADAAEQLSAAVRSFPKTTVAHLAGADFGVLIEGVDGPGLGEATAQLAAAVAGLHERHPLASADVGHVGAARFSGQGAGALLAEADRALREAQRSGANAWVVRASTDTVAIPRGRSDWRGLLDASIEQGHFRLLRQPVVARDGEALLHEEVFLRVADPDHPGQDLPAAVFMPMAEGVGLAPRIDRAVIERLFEALAGGQFEGRVAVNLSPLSLLEPAFDGWLVETLQQRPSLARRLIFEVPEYGASGHVEALTRLIARLAPLGVEFSLDHFGRGFASFGYLRSIKADYLKIDGSFIQQLETREDNRFFVRTIAEIAHGLDMRVVAESVETEAAWALLRTLGVDGGRGFLFGRPA